MPKPIDTSPVARTLRVQFVALVALFAVGWFQQDGRLLLTTLIVGSIWWLGMMTRHALEKKDGDEEED